MQSAGGRRFAQRLSYGVSVVRGSAMAARDAMQFINEQDDATLQRFVERLEFRGRDRTFVGYRQAYVEKMALAPRAVVLDLGCGTGVVARALAATSGFSGRVIGIEQSPLFVEVA